jgi:hypothetical protein
MDEHANFERAPIQRARLGPSFDDKAPPALGGKTEIAFVQYLFTAGVPKPAHER